MKYILQFSFGYALNKQSAESFEGWYGWDPEVVWAIFEKRCNEPDRPMIGECQELLVWGQVDPYKVIGVTHTPHILAGSPLERHFDKPSLEMRRSGIVIELEPYVSDVPFDAHEDDDATWRNNRRENIIGDTSQLLAQGFWIHDASWNYDPSMEHIRRMQLPDNVLCPRCFHRMLDVEGTKPCFNCGFVKKTI